MLRSLPTVTIPKLSGLYFQRKVNAPVDLTVDKESIAWCVVLSACGTCTARWKKEIGIRIDDCYLIGYERSFLIIYKGAWQAFGETYSAEKI